MQFDEDVYRDQLYTEQQSRLLTNVPRVSGSLSMLGSSVILYIILRDRKRKLQRVYHRLLLVYSLIDILVSLNYALSAAVVPVGTPGVWGAQGTIATCNASGFVTQFSLSQGVYGSFICVYYVLVLRYQVREQTLARKVEPFVHAFALVTPVVIGIFQLQAGNYNPTNVIMGWCFINVYPMDCLRNDEVECERGADYEPWLIANNAPFFLLWFIVISSCVLTFLKVRSVEQQGSRWSISPSQASTRRVRETATQVSLYIGAFCLTYIFLGIGTLAGPSPANKAHRNFYFPVVLLTKIFLPSNGIWNSIIYIRPRYTAIRLRNPTFSTWKVFKLVVVSHDDPVRPHGVDMSFRRGNRRHSMFGNVSRWMSRSTGNLFNTNTKSCTSDSAHPVDSVDNDSDSGSHQNDTPAPPSEHSLSDGDASGQEEEQRHRENCNDDFMPEFVITNRTVDG